MHGREWINVQIAMAQIEDYLGQERYAALLRETALVFVPMCNPDGVRIAQEGADWIEDEAARAEYLHRFETPDTVFLALCVAWT